MSRETATFFLCGDVMIGRGVDQILPHPSRPELHESYVHDAREYVELAERANGPIPRPVGPGYIWGDALAVLDRAGPDARIVNLETSVTCADTYWPGKDIHYRMHPANIPILAAARLDVCALANNHVLDYGYAGLEETLRVLHAAGIRTAGAGRDRLEAEQPAIVDIGGGSRLILFSTGSATSGIPSSWAATDHRAGVDLLPDLSKTSADRLLDRIARVANRGDLVVVSIHWGSNWGYAVPESHVRFAHRLLDGGVALVHGHSSHHPRPIEIYDRKLVLYGCGDFLNDYEGIGGYEEFRSDLALMYFPTLGVESGELVALRMTPMRIRRMQAVHAAREDGQWLARTLTRVSARFGVRVETVEADEIGVALTAHPLPT